MFCLAINTGYTRVVLQKPFFPRIRLFRVTECRLIDSCQRFLFCLNASFCGKVTEPEAYRG